MLKKRASSIFFALVLLGSFIPAWASYAQAKPNMKQDMKKSEAAKIENKRSFLDRISDVPAPSCKYVLPIAKEIQYVSNIGIISVALLGSLTSSNGLFFPIFILGSASYISGKSLESCYES